MALQGRPVPDKEYIVTTSNGSLCKVGDKVVLYRDDGTDSPWFNNLTNPVNNPIPITLSKLKEYVSMDNLQNGTVLVRKSDPSEDYYLVLGTFNYEGDEKVAVLDLFDDSADPRTVELSELKSDFYVKGEVPAEAELKEVTLEEVAKAMNVSVEKLRIKE